MSEVGEILRDERIRRGLSPTEVAGELKIAPYLIHAIESGQFDRLPGGIYRRSFLRQYAHILGVDEDEIVAGFKEQYGDPEVALPPPCIERHTGSWNLLWMAVAIAACVFGYRFLQNERPALGVHIASTAAASAPTEAPKIAPAEAAVKLPPAEAAVKLAPTQLAAAAEPQPPTDAAKPVRVAFTPTEPVWIVVQCDGAESFRGILEGPATREFGATKRLTVLIGNSGGVTVSWHGRPIGPIGARGEVQTLEVTAEGARVLPRKHARVPAPDGGGTPL
jgi:cytoskeleton protein RodZ